MAQANLLKAIFILTYVSLTTTLIIFVLSMLDLGIASWWTNIVIPLLTGAYHITILILHRRVRRTDGTQPQGRIYPTSTIANLVCAYLLALFWLLPLGVMANTITRVVPERDKYLAGNIGTFVTQAILDATEVGILAAVAVISTRMRLNARRWVPIDPVRLSSAVAT